MTANEFFKVLAGKRGDIAEDGGELTLSPGPIILKIGPQDIRAARLLLWMQEELLPEDATYGDMEDVLDAAKWWGTFWASIPERLRKERRLRGRA